MRNFPKGIAVWALSLIFFLGCSNGDGIQRVVVTGVVTYSGSPVADGQIRFIPATATPGPITITTIEKGNYRFDVNGGVPVGKHRVEVLSFDPDTPPPRGAGEPQRRQFLPAKYNRQSELKCVVESQPNPVSKNFDLK